MAAKVKLCRIITLPWDSGKAGVPQEERPAAGRGGRMDLIYRNDQYMRNRALTIYISHKICC